MAAEDLWDLRSKVTGSSVIPAEAGIKLVFELTEIEPGFHRYDDHPRDDERHEAFLRRDLIYFEGRRGYEVAASIRSFSVAVARYSCGLCSRG